MKTKMRALSVALLIALMLGAFTIHAYSIEPTPNEIDNEVKAEAVDMQKINFGILQGVNGLEGTQKTVSHNGKATTATFSYTFNQKDVLPEDGGDIYGIYDVFVDEEGIEYYFRYKSNKYLGFCTPVNYAEETGSGKAISQEEAISIAEEYIPSIVDDPKAYIYSDTIENRGFEVRFVYSLNGIKTSELIKVTVSYTGEILAAFCLNIGEFEQYKYKKLSVEPSEKVMEYCNIKSCEKMDLSEFNECLEKSATAESTVNESYITTDNYGNLLFHIFIHGSADCDTDIHREEVLPLTAA